MMIVYDNLNKEDFWNQLHEKFPDAVNHFCEWIDEYKKANNWDALFNSDSNWQDANGKNAQSPKFHDLPIEMQQGILVRFEMEIAARYNDPKKQMTYKEHMKRYKNQVGIFFSSLHVVLKKKLN